jgi:uncharacterized membrane protein YphA (DoxX/SURF4 family)
MKLLVNIARIVVGVLFIFSGLIKANDPLGLSYKMQEFFDLWHLTQFNVHTLWLSVVMIAFEIIAGAALLLGWRMRLFSWLLLLLIIFFTFLTGYAYLSGKFKNCGCFGDCIPITPLTSFLKDVLLTILILFLFFFRRHIRPLFSARATALSMLLITIFSFAIQWYMLNYLPVFDCLPYKKGNNIPEKMKIPAGSVPDSFAIRFIYEKAGNKYEFAPAELPADLDTYTYVSRQDKLVRQGNAEAPIRGFSLSGITNEDSTDIVLSDAHAVVLFVEDFSTPIQKWQKGFETVYAEAKQKNIPVYAVTNRMDEAKEYFSKTSFAAIPLFKCDYTTIRTAARTNPCIYLLEKGTIINKWSYRNMSQVIQEIKALVVPAREAGPSHIDSLPQPLDTPKIK